MTSIMESSAEYFRRNVERHRETLILLGHLDTRTSREAAIEQRVASGWSRAEAEKAVDADGNPVPGYKYP